MLQSVGRTDPAFQANASSSPRATAGDGADLYRADWRPAGGSAAQPPIVLAQAAAPAPASDNDPATIHRNALLSQDVYRSAAAASPPAGTRVASTADLDRLGLTEDMLVDEESGFAARVYVTGAPGEERFTIAFRGSELNWNDWRTNAAQPLGIDTVQYRRALEIGQTIARSGLDVDLTGHSLGGGLAATAAIASGRHADTFNAAGLGQATIGRAQAAGTREGVGPGPVDNHRVPGEVLTWFQEGGDRTLGGLAGGLFGPLGRGAGTLLADAPEAYGEQHDLPLVRPREMNWFQAQNRIDRHMIEWAVAGAAAQAAR